MPANGDLLSTLRHVEERGLIRFGKFGQMTATAVVFHTAPPLSCFTIFGISASRFREMHQPPGKLLANPKTISTLLFVRRTLLTG
jgi:hypothetical protein